MGLRRAFEMAGAKTVVSSLWSVQDDSTSRLMQDFYRNLWVRGLSELEALREAQLKMLRENRVRDGEGHPEGWGAFVLSGDWR
jgi:CHAT domain-containing protein